MKHQSYLSYTTKTRKVSGGDIIRKETSEPASHFCPRCLDKTLWASSRMSAWIVKAYRQRLGQCGLPLDPVMFAEALNRATDLMRDLQPGFAVTPRTVLDWERGATRPNPVYLVALLNLAPEGSWPAHFASDLLVVRFPDDFEPTGPVGKWMMSDKGECEITHTRKEQP